MLCDHLEGWDREGGREGDSRGKRYGDIRMHMTDSLCYTAETNTTLQSNYTPIKMLKEIKRRDTRLPSPGAGVHPMARQVTDAPGCPLSVLGPAVLSQRAALKLCITTRGPSW